MDQLTILRIIVTCAAIGCSVFGFLFLFAPDSIRRLDQEINRPRLNLDDVLAKQPYLVGTFLPLVGIPLLCLMVFV